MATPQPIGQTNGQSNGHPLARNKNAPTDESASNGTGIGPLIEEAQALRDALHEAYERSRRLVSAVKRQRQRSRLMASTLASLKQLQQFQTLDR
jgi:hypothetical protein